MSPISFPAIPFFEEEKLMAVPARVDWAVNRLQKMPVACVILPTYNEVENVKQVIPAVFQQAAKISDSHELQVLVVDDDSPDGTYGAVKKLQGKYKNLHVINGTKRGLGNAYKRGIKYALEHLWPDVIIQMDADGQHDPEKLPQFIALSNSGYQSGDWFEVGTRWRNTGLFTLEKILESFWKLADSQPGGCQKDPRLHIRISLHKSRRNQKV